MLAVQKLVRGLRPWKQAREVTCELFHPTSFFSHHLMQTVCELRSKRIDLNFEREKIYFKDGGHVSMDWLNYSQSEPSRPVVFIMHGLTGGSQTNYIRALARRAMENGYTCVCFNSRGINSEMTSPLPFTGYGFEELEAALEIIHRRQPNSKLHLIGTSFGGNYLLRYLIKNKRTNAESLSLIAAPFNLKNAVDRMSYIYQKFFLRIYMEASLNRHEKMKYWWDNHIIDLELLKKTKSLREFHRIVTAKILGMESEDQFFEYLRIDERDLLKLNVNTLVLAARDDPMVDFQSLPLSHLQRNAKIETIITDKGGHMCWFEGKTPERWYPKPVFEFINRIQNSTGKVAHL